VNGGTTRRAGPLARLRAATAGGPLGDRSFQLPSAGQLASTIGDLCYAVALPWLVLSNHGGTVLLGAVLACYGVPRTVLIPVGGILADRIGPRLVMPIADAARCVLVTALVVLATRHVISLAVLGPVAALIGAGEGLFPPAQFTIIPSIVEPGQPQAANAISTALTRSARCSGPCSAGCSSPSPAPHRRSPSTRRRSPSRPWRSPCCAPGPGRRPRPRRTPRPRPGSGRCCARHACSRSPWWP
jgi:MFS family permease